MLSYSTSLLNELAQQCDANSSKITVAICLEVALLWKNKHTSYRVLFLWSLSITKGIQCLPCLLFCFWCLCALRSRFFKASFLFHRHLPQGVQRVHFASPISYLVFIAFSFDVWTVIRYNSIGRHVQSLIQKIF